MVRDRVRRAEKIRVLDREALAEDFAQHGISREFTDPEGVVRVVVDVDALRQRLKQLYTDGSARTEEETTTIVDSLIALFPAPVLTETQIARGENAPKPLFYVPESAEAATNFKALKNVRFHITLPDALAKMKLRIPMPVVRGENVSVSLLEAHSAILIFHPRYGDGARDPESGDLIVNEGERGFRKFSGEFLEQRGINDSYFLHSGQLRSGAGDRTVRQGVAAELPHLVARKLVGPLDFRGVSTLTAEAQFNPIFRRGVYENGTVVFNGVRHTLSRNFAKEGLLIGWVAPELGCVIDASKGYERVTHIFSVVGKDKARRSGATDFLADASMTHLRELTPESIGVVRRVDETVAEYEQRIELMDRGFAYLVRVIAPRFPFVAQLLTSMPIGMQAEVAQTVYLLEKEHKAEEFGAFVERFGLEGLKAFLVAGQNLEVVDGLFALAKRGPDETMREIVGMYNKTYEAAERLAAGVRATGSASTLFTDHMPGIVMRRASQLFKADTDLETLGTAFKGFELAMQVSAEALSGKRGDGTEADGVVSGGLLGGGSYKFVVRHGGSEFECKILIRPEEELGDKTGAEGKVPLPARINFEVSVPESMQGLHQAFAPGVQIEGAASKALRRLNKSTIRFAFDLDKNADGTYTCFADLGRGANALGTRGVRSGDVLGTLLDTVGGHQMSAGVSEQLSDPEAFAIPARSLEGVLRSHVERLLSDDL